MLKEQLGESLAQTALSQFGYSCGLADYEAFADAYKLDDDREHLELGLALQRVTGVAQATLETFSLDRSKGDLRATGRWVGSYEAEVHLASEGPDEHPVCHTLAGYLSGWSTGLLGAPALAIERSCMGQGEEHCTFEIRPYGAWGKDAERWRRGVEGHSTSLSSELAAKTALIREQEAAISELSTPVMEIWDDILVLPIVGIVDTRRSMEIMNNLLDRIVETQSRCVIVDVTGVEVVDTKTADYLLKVIRAANLLGSRCVLTGLSPAIAQTLVEIGANLAEVNTLRNIKEGLKDCLRYLRSNRGASR